MDKIEKIFNQFEKEYSKFDLIENKLSKRADMHAFLLLDSMFPNNPKDIISAATHDEIYLSISPEELIDIATVEQIRDLVRCGVMYYSDTDSLAMFV